MVTFRCANVKSCSAGFPLSENTKEKLIHCPACGHETNIWLKLKKMQELKDHRRMVMREIAGNRKKEPSDAVRELRTLMVEWDAVLIRPYEDVSRLERDLRVSLLLQYADYDNEWLKNYS